VPFLFEFEVSFSRNRIFHVSLKSRLKTIVIIIVKNSHEKNSNSNHTTTKTHLHNNILADRHNGLVTLKDLGLPDDGFD
jgi:hypothetical protein